MIEQYHHKVTSSFMLWFDHYLLTKGQAYTNISGAKCYNYDDERLDDRFEAFGSPYKQWVNDSSVDGATIANGIYIGNTPSGEYSGGSRGGLKLDFHNGRALIETNDQNLDISCDFAVKDFNIYFTNETEDDLIVENKYSVNSRTPSAIESYIEPYDYVLPAVFIAAATSKNEDFAFGGMEETTINISATVLAEDSYQLDGVLSIFSDAKNECIPLVTMADHPYDEFNDLKSGVYNYNDLSSGNPNKLFLNRTTTSKLTDKIRKSLSNDMFVGFIDFEVQQHRFRHQ